MKLSVTRKYILTASVIGFSVAGVSVQAALAESRSYVVNWFTQAAFSENGSCPQGENPNMEEQFASDLKDIGKTDAEIADLMKGGLFEDGGKLQQTLINRARVDGKPANAYANPAAAVDPHLKIVGGPHAYGFNLDGRGAQSPASFEDPETHEVGVNNQLFRALGCIHAFEGSIDNRPSLPQWAWTMLKDSQPAWIITISGNDLNKDGNVTIAFERALEHATLYFDGEVRPDVAFRVDPDPRSHNLFQGKIEDGVVTITEPAKLHLLGNQLQFPEFDLYQAHLRLTMKPTGNLDGFVGGYQPWLQVYWQLSEGGFGPERTLGVDAVGVYHVLRRLADAYPDPRGGQNTAISATYRIEAVPAFAAFPGAAANGKTAGAILPAVTAQVP